MKIVKILAAIILVVLIVVGIGVYFVFQNLNDIVKYAVEEGGTEATRTEVLLSKADIDIRAGRGELDGLSIANPQGFSSEKLFSFNKIVLDIEPTSITKDVIVIDEITIDGVNVRAEHKNLTETNIEAMLKNLTQGAGGSSSGSSSTSESSGKEVLLAVKKLVFSNSKLSLSSDQLGSFDLTVPSFEVNNLGSADNGLTPKQLAEAALKPLLKKAKDQVEKTIKDKAEDEVKSKIEDKLKEKINQEDLDKLKGLKSLFDKG